MAPQMDRPERLGEARCEISRGGQAKGGGAVFEEIRWHSLRPLSALNRPPGPQLWSRPDCCRGTKPAGLLGGAGGLVACGFLPLECPSHEAARCYVTAHIVRRLSWLVFRRSPPASQRTRSAGCHSQMDSALAGQGPIGIPEAGEWPPRQLDRWTGWTGTLP